MQTPDSHELTTFAALVNGEVSNPEIQGNFIERLDYHGISALVYENNQQNSSLNQALGYRKPLMVANEALKSQELNQLFTALHEAGLHQCLVFKGTAMAYQHYPKTWLRPRTDTDILIDAAAINRFDLVFKQLGYERQFGMSGKYVSYQCTYGKHLVGAATINIDVHWRINNRQCLSNAYNLEELLADSHTLSKLSNHINAPCSVDSLLIACLHRLGHHHREERLAWLYDIHLIAQSLAAPEWESLLIKAKHKKLCALGLDGLEKAKQYFKTPIPTHVLTSLEAAKSQLEPSAIFLHRDLSYWQVLISDVKAIPTYSGKFSFLLETAFPSASYIHRRTNRRSLLTGYIVRAISGIKRLIS